MPNPTKKVMVKVPKKTAETKVEMEAYVPKGLSKEFIAKVNETTDYNKKRNEVESMAKSDSIVGAKKAKFEGKDLVDQRRSGNRAANETRKEGNVPQVARGRSTNTEPDKYYAGGYSALTSDSYSRIAPLEKDMPIIKKVLVKKTKKS
jgi:hypothetical protein